MGTMFKIALKRDQVVKQVKQIGEKLWQLPDDWPLFDKLPLLHRRVLFLLLFLVLLLLLTLPFGNERHQTDAPKVENSIQQEQPSQRYDIDLQSNTRP